MIHVDLLKSQSHHRKEVDRGLLPGYLLLCDFTQNLTLKVQYGRNCRLEEFCGWMFGSAWHCFSYLVMPFFSTQYYISEGSPQNIYQLFLDFR